MQIAKIAVEAATYAIDKPYSYGVPAGMDVSVAAGCWYPLAGETAPARGSSFRWRRVCRMAR